MLVALFAAAALEYRVGFPPKSRKFDVNSATARLLVDTPSSQIVAVSPTAMDVLTARANLLASLMVDGVVKTAIAQRAGLPPGQIAGVALSAPDLTPSAPPAPGGYVLTTNVLTDTQGTQLPIIEIDTQAPDAAGAARLANAAVVGLQDYLGSQAASQAVPQARRLRVTGLGAAQASEVARGPRVLMAAGLAVFIFVAGCAAILRSPRSSARGVPSQTTRQLPAQERKRT